MLNFEASGALLHASLVMRDRETDSWWSIMNSVAIGGELEGTNLTEIPVAEKASWKDWVGRYPGTLVLSVSGHEHLDASPYEGYFGSKRTFRGLTVEDKRLKPKDPVFTFWIGGQAFASPHRDFEGGKLFDVEALAGKKVLLYRPIGASVFPSTQAYLVDTRLAHELGDLAKLLSAARAGSAEGVEKLGGFDTYWYTWIAVNSDSKLLR